MTPAGNFSEEERITTILGNCANATNISHHQTNLREYTAYKISVAGVSRKGFGESTDKIIVFTDEDSKYNMEKRICIYFCIICEEIKELRHAGCSTSLALEKIDM